MKVCNTNRNAFFLVLNAAFNSLKLKPAIIELGVLRGENASNMYEFMKPCKMVLVDTWSAIAMQGAFHPFKDAPSWIASPAVLDAFYGGSIAEQDTFDRIYDQCSARFESCDNVEIIRADTIEVLNRFKGENGDEKFNIVYVDANHRYEHVLRELLCWHEHVAIDGALVLNDCCHSDGGIKMNFGVLPALTEFIKRTDFIPVMLTNTDWSDVVLVRKDCMLDRLLDEIVRNSDIAFVDIPHQLIGSGRIVQGSQRCNVSFV